MQNNWEHSNLISEFCIVHRQICTLELCLSRFVWAGISTSPLCSCWWSLPSTLLQVCMCMYFVYILFKSLRSVSFINVFIVFMLTSPALFWSKQIKQSYCGIWLQSKITFVLFYYILKCTLFLWLQIWIVNIFTPVFSVTWSSCTWDISHYYQCWQHLCCLIFVWKQRYFFQDSWKRITV